MTGITGKFINNELISIHGFQPIISTSRDVPSKYANSHDVNVIHVSQSFVLDEPLVRGLVSESSNIFYSLQTAKDKSSDIYLRTSRAYRSAVRSTINQLQEDEDKYGDFISIFYSIECLWHLCEFLLIDHSTNSVVPNLIEWVSEHGTIQ